MAKFNYDAPAELFAGRSQRGPRPMMYQRFDTGAKALRYAIEQMPPANLLGSVLEVNERRYGHLEIRAYYDAPEYPYKRKAVKAKKEPKAKSEAKASEVKAEAKADAKAETKAAPKAETKLARKPAQAKRQLETAGASRA
jgi:hypothetical protein